MSRRDEDLTAELAELGDDRPGIDDLEGDDFTALQLDDDDSEDLDEDDEDEEDDDDQDDGDEDEDYPEDATDDEIDLVVALYREDGKPAGLALPKDLANDFDELCNQLRRVPGDAGAMGAVAIDDEFFLLVRVRGKVVQTALSDVVYANDWPVARDAADYLGLDIPDDDEDGGPAGDLDMFVDVGLTELELETICSDLDAGAEELVRKIAKKLGFGPAYTKVIGAFGL